MIWHRIQSEPQPILIFVSRENTMSIHTHFLEQVQYETKKEHEIKFWASEPCRGKVLVSASAQSQQLEHLWPRPLETSQK